MDTFADRVVTQQQQRLFVSYTPTELALRRGTIDAPAWVKEIEALTGKKMERHELEAFFRHYINDRFPLRMADPVDFAQYVAQEVARSKAAPPPPFRAPGLWWHSDPRGQGAIHYPSMEHLDEPVGYDMFR